LEEEEGDFDEVEDEEEEGEVDERRVCCWFFCRFGFLLAPPTGEVDCEEVLADETRCLFLDAEAVGLEDLDLDADADDDDEEEEDGDDEDDVDDDEDDDDEEDLNEGCPEDVGEGERRGELRGELRGGTALVFQQISEECSIPQ